jgi:hypothetical protein
MASIVSNAFDALGASRSHVMNSDGSYRRRYRTDSDAERGEELLSIEEGGIKWETTTRPPRARLTLRYEEIGQPKERIFTGQSAMSFASKRSEKIFEDLVSLQYVVIYIINQKNHKLTRTGTNVSSAMTRSLSRTQCGHATNAAKSTTSTV